VFCDFEAPEKIKAQLGEKATSSLACAIGAFIDLRRQKRN
jgi:hypothetical protein